MAGTRERAVLPLLPGCVASQINTGDYLVCYREGLASPRVLASIERKTYEDLAASIRDNRYSNLAGMLDLRARTGCQLYLLLEGPAHPSSKSRFGGLPFAQLESVAMDLMTQSGIRVVHSVDVAHSAARLLALLGSFARFGSGGASEGPAAKLPPVVKPVQHGTARAPGAATGAGSPKDQGNVPAGMRRRLPRTTENAAILMWSELRGISAILAGILVREFSLAKLALQEVEVAHVRKLRTATGRPINKVAQASLLGVRNGAEEHAVRAVQALRGLTPAGAGVILRHFGGLPGLCRGGVGEVAEVVLPHPAGPTKLGRTLATQLVNMLHYRAPPPAALAEEVFSEEHGAVPRTVQEGGRPCECCGRGSAPRESGEAVRAPPITDDDVMDILGLA